VNVLQVFGDFAGFLAHDARNFPNVSHDDGDTNEDDDKDDSHEYDHDGRDEEEYVGVDEGLHATSIAQNP